MFIGKCQKLSLLAFLLIIGPKLINSAPMTQLEQLRVDLARGFVTCGMQLVETIPKSLEYRKIKSNHKSIYDAWQEMFENTQEELAVMSQWAIKAEGKGKKIYDQLKTLVKKGIASVKMIYFNHDLFEFDKKASPTSLKAAEKFPNQVQFKRPSIRGLTNPRVTENVLHSKVFISDKKHVYLGSANLGSRCTTRTKELGILINNCPSLAQDAHKQWSLYWSLDGVTKLPGRYPEEMSTSINAQTPLKIFNNLDNTLYNVFIAASPVSLTAQGRSDDLTAVVRIIDNAEKFVHIVVGEYLAMDAYKDQQPWTLIDDRIRKAVSERGVEVKFMVSDHASRVDLMAAHLKRLMGDLNDNDGRRPKVQVRLFDSQFDIHNFHGTHAKFMVTEKAGFIGTSNWTEDYFSDSAGISITFEPVVKTAEGNANLVDQLEGIFIRDWNSKLAIPL